MEHMKNMGVGLVVLAICVSAAFIVLRWPLQSAGSLIATLLLTLSYLCGKAWRAERAWKRTQKQVTSGATEE